MPGTLSRHPGTEQLAAFRLGKLGPEEFSELEQHLAGCGSCCDLLLALPDDSLLALVRQAGMSTGSSSEATAADRSDRRQGGFGPASPQTAEEPEVPEELAGHPRYRVLKPLGVGGMGAVFKAEHLLMERGVALKVINRPLVARPGFVERFRREVRAAARLDHPNIVRAHDAEQAGSCHFLVMEYVEGTTLAVLVAERGPLPVSQACEYVRQAALGLQHAFENGMVHRDVKPHNLMVTPAGQVKILDFGLARFASELAAPETPAGPRQPPASDAGLGITAAGTVLGTADYIAPEQVGDPRAADIRADVYSLGCTLYYLLTGQPPFPAGTVEEKLEAHEGQQPVPVTRLRQDVPPGLGRVLERMLEKRPAARYQTPAEVADAVLPFVTGGCPGLPHAERPRGARPTPTSLWLWGALSAAAALLAAAVFHLQTPHGTVRVEINDPNVKVSFAGKVITFQDEGRMVRVTPGDHVLAVEHGDLKFETPRFTLGKGENPPLKVELLKGQVQVRQGERILDRHAVSPPEQAAPGIRPVRSFEGHRGPVRRVTVSPDGRFAVSGSGYLLGDGTLRLWDLDTGRQVRNLGGFGPPVMAAAFSPDGQRVASGGADHTVRVWDAATGAELLSLQGHSGWADVLAFTPDGRRLLAASRTKDGNGEVRLWDTQTGKQERLILTNGRVLSIAFLPGGAQPVAATFGSEGKIRLLNLENGKEVATFPALAEDVEEVAISPDGRLLASGGAGGRVRLWDVLAREPLADWQGHSRRVLRVAFTPDGRHLISGGHDAVLRVFEVATRREVASLKHPAGSVWDVAVTPDGRQVLTAGGTTGPGEKDGKPKPNGDYALRLWQLPTGVWPAKGTGPARRQPAPGRAPLPPADGRPRKDNPPKAVPDLVKEARLLLTFEKDTFYDRAGKTHVRDLSGHGSDGVCWGKAAFTPEGKAGGGLSCAGGALRVPPLLDRQPNFTLAAWVRREALQNGRLFERRTVKGGPTCAVEFPHTHCRVVAHNVELLTEKTEAWRDAATPPNWVPVGKWFFVAVRLENGGAGKGSLRITVDDKRYEGSLQAVRGPSTGDVWIGRLLQGQVDEVAVFHRALSEEEVRRLHAWGLSGRPLPAPDQKGKKPSARPLFGVTTSTPAVRR